MYNNIVTKSLSIKQKVFIIFLIIVLVIITIFMLGVFDKKNNIIEQFNAEMQEMYNSRIRSPRSNNVA